MRNIIIIGLAAVLLAAGFMYFTAPDGEAPPPTARKTAAGEAPDTPAGKAPLAAAALDDGGKLTAPAFGRSPAQRNGKVVVAKEASKKTSGTVASRKTSGTEATRKASGKEAFKIASRKEASKEAPGKKASKDAAASDRAMSAIKPPAFDIVRIAKDRTAVVAGRAPPGSTVRLSLDGKIVAETPVGQRGEWVAVIDQPLPSGQAELDLVAVMPDGGIIAAGSDVAVVIPEAASRTAAATKVARKERRTALAVLLPKSNDAPVILLQKPEPKGGPSSNKLSVDTVDYDDKGNVVISGSAPPGAKVRTYVDNKPVGLSQADRKSVWELKPKAELAPGTHILRVDQLDISGRVVSRVELPFVRVAAAEILATTTARFRVIVQPGNSLWRIARRVYGSGDRYTVIYQANDSQIRDPDMIFPGQVFKLPTDN